MSDPLGEMGNPFVVVVGRDVENIAYERRCQIAQSINTSETMFVNYCRPTHAIASPIYCVGLSVYTPLGNELGACAHGTIGAIRSLLSMGRLKQGSEIEVCTTLDRKLQALVSPHGMIALVYRGEPTRHLAVPKRRLERVFRVSMGDAVNLGVLSVGSPKLTVELSIKAFESLRHSLDYIDYDALLTLQQELDINGVHMFCRDPESLLPCKCIQANAFLGPENCVDRATGVSSAGQIAADDNVRAGQTVEIVQYAKRGPSAILNLVKNESGTVAVSGHAVLYNHVPII